MLALGHAAVHGKGDGWDSAGVITELALGGALLDAALRATYERRWPSETASMLAAEARACTLRVERLKRTIVPRGRRPPRPCLG